MVKQGNLNRVLIPKMEIDHRKKQLEVEDLYNDLINGRIRYEAGDSVEDKPIDVAAYYMGNTLLNGKGDSGVNIVAGEFKKRGLSDEQILKARLLVLLRRIQYRWDRDQSFDLNEGRLQK